MKQKKVKDLLEEIKQKEGNRLYQVYICVERLRKVNLFKFYKKRRLYNEAGERGYYKETIHRLTFAIRHDIEARKKVIRCDLKREEHINMSLSGATATGYHNTYYIFIQEITPGNETASITERIDRDFIPYKPGELTEKQKGEPRTPGKRRFTL